MNLTGIFGSGKRISDTGKAGQTNNANTASVNRQIRSLIPGQTIQGEVLSREGGEVQIRLSDDMILHARVDQNMNLELGKNMTFEVRNNGSALTLSPLFANMASDANALKALEMASLPINETTVNMTRQLMDAGLPIDRASLQQVFREVSAFPQADVADIVDLHRLGLPVTEENVEQMASYKNLTYQILDGMNDVIGSLSETLQNMVQSGNVEGAARLYQEILSLAGELPSGVLPEGELPAGELPVGELPVGELPAGEPQSGKEHILQALQPELAGLPEEGESLKEMAASGSLEKPGPEVMQALKLLEEMAGDGRDTALSGALTKGKEAELPLSLQSGTQTLAKELSAVMGQTLPEDLDSSQLLQLAGRLLEKGVAEHDTRLLRQLLGSKPLRDAVDQSIQNLWTIKPEEVSDAKKVEELYQRLDRQLKSLTQALEHAGQENSASYKAAVGMSQNIDFLHQVNQMYAYVQLPLKLQQGNAHGDLYVYTNKKKLTAQDGKISALLHLDMEHLGPVDVYVSLQKEKVNTQFYVQDDDMLDFLMEHMDLLTERLKKRGYDCSFRMQVRGEKEADGERGMKPLLSQAGHVKLAQYAFDVRA